MSKQAPMLAPWMDINKKFVDEAIATSSKKKSSPAPAAAVASFAAVAAMAEEPEKKPMKVGLQHLADIRFELKPEAKKKK